MAEASKCEFALINKTGAGRLAVTNLKRNEWGKDTSISTASHALSTLSNARSVPVVTAASAAAGLRRYHSCCARGHAYVFAINGIGNSDIYYCFDFLRGVAVGRFASNFQRHNAVM